jgi:hypothetical protein
VKLQKLQPKNHELYVAAGQAAQAFGNAQGALDEFSKALGVIKVLLWLAVRPRSAHAWPPPPCACVHSPASSVPAGPVLPVQQARW